MNTPNKITLARLLLIPVIVFFYLAEFIPYAKLVSAIVFVVACLTDFLDGYLARKNNQVTTLGKFFDTIADKILITTGLILISASSINGGNSVASAGGSNWFSIVCVIIILAREFIVSALRQLAASKGTILAADMGGKIKATAQFVVVSLYMFLAFVETTIAPMITPSSLGAYSNAIVIIKFILMLLLVATAILTVYTGASYLIRNRHVFSENKEDAEIVKEIEEEKNQSLNQKEEEKTEISNNAVQIKTGKIDDVLDPILPNALKMAIEQNSISTTFVQRNFSIGYPRAARIIDQMEERGYISQANGAQPRKILITKEEFEKLFGNID